MLPICDETELKLEKGRKNTVAYAWCALGFGILLVVVSLVVWLVAGKHLREVSEGKSREAHLARAFKAILFKMVPGASIVFLVSSWSTISYFRREKRSRALRSERMRATSVKDSGHEASEEVGLVSGNLKRAQDRQTRIRNILIRKWDPIGVSEIPTAQDEYDAYVQEVNRLISRRETCHVIFDYLWWVETKHMGLAGDRQKCESVSKELAALDQ
jgi:hypothetical protein